MAKKLITTTYMTNIANSIRTKLGVATTYKPSEMSAAIDSIPSGSNTFNTVAYRFTSPDYSGGTYWDAAIFTTRTDITLSELAQWLYDNGYTSSSNVMIYPYFTGSSLITLQWSSNVRLFSTDGITINVNSDSYTISALTVDSAGRTGTYDIRKIS